MGFLLEKDTWQDYDLSISAIWWLVWADDGYGRTMLNLIGQLFNESTGEHEALVVYSTAC